MERGGREGVRNWRHPRFFAQPLFTQGFYLVSALALEKPFFDQTGERGKRSVRVSRQEAKNVPFSPFPPTRLTQNIDR